MSGAGNEAVAAEPVGSVAPARGASAAEGFEALYRRAFPRVYAYVASILRDRTEAEDVTALAFERAWRRRWSYRPSRGSMEAWVFGIARNAALDELRRRKRQAALLVDPEDVAAEPTEGRVEALVRRETVRAALSKLSQRERDLIALKFFGGLSNGEIGRALGRRMEAGFPRESRFGAFAAAAGRVRERGARAGTSVRGLGDRASGVGRAISRKLAGRRPLPVLAGVASAVLALAVTVALLTGDRRDGGTGAPVPAPLSEPRDGTSAQETPPGAARRAQPEASQAAPGDDAVGIVPPQPPPTGIAPGERERRVEHGASLTLKVPGDRLEPAAGRIATIAARHKGFVLSSSLTTGEDAETRGGSFDIRVPVAALRETLADLARVGTVRSLTQTGEDRTQPYVSARERLRTARAERRGLLRRLERADTDREAEAIRRRLRIVSQQIRSARAEVRDLSERTAFAAIAVTLEAGPPEETRGTLGAATDDAIDTLAGALGLTIRALAILIPITLLTALALLAAATIRRRRREGILGD